MQARPHISLDASDGLESKRYYNLYVEKHAKLIEVDTSTSWVRTIIKLSLYIFTKSAIIYPRPVKKRNR